MVPKMNISVYAPEFCSEMLMNGPRIDARLLLSMK